MSPSSTGSRRALSEWFLGEARIGAYCLIDPSARKKPGRQQDEAREPAAVQRKMSQHDPYGIDAGQDRQQSQEQGWKTGTQVVPFARKTSPF